MRNQNNKFKATNKLF